MLLRNLSEDVMIINFHNHQTRRRTSSKQRLQSLTSNLPRFSSVHFTRNRDCWGLLTTTVVAKVYTKKQNQCADSTDSTFHDDDLTLYRRMYGCSLLPKNLTCSLTCNEKEKIHKVSSCEKRIFRL